MQVDGFLIDDDNEDKFWRHGLAADDVLQVLDGPHIIERNRKERRAGHLIVGRDHAGGCIAIPIEPTHDPTVWPARYGMALQGQRAGEIVAA